MDISAATNPSGRAAYIKAQSNIAQAEKKADTYTPARTPDEVAISFEAQEILAKEGTEGSFPVDAVSEEQVNSIRPQPSPLSPMSLARLLKAMPIRFGSIMLWSMKKI